MTARLKGAAAGALAALALGAACGRRPAAPAAVREKNTGGWEEVPLGTDAVFNGLHFVDADVGWIVGGSPFVSGGIAGRTEDGGKTWRYVSGVTKGGPTRGLVAVRGLDRMRACAVGAGIFVTFDGGQSWQPAQGAHGADHLSAVDFIDDREGWAAGATGVFHTGDGGLTWTRRDAEAEPRIGSTSPRTLRFVDSRNGFLAGQLGNVWRTLDGEELRAVQALDADTAWAVGDRVRTEPQRILRRAGRPGA